MPPRPSDVGVSESERRRVHEAKAKAAWVETNQSNPAVVEGAIVADHNVIITSDRAHACEALLR